MPEFDINGFEIKSGHDGGRGLPIGDPVWLLRRFDDKLYGVWTSRHAAAGAAATMTTNKEKWLEPVRVPAGSVRIQDTVILNESPEGEER